MKVRAKMPFPVKIVPTWMVSQTLLKMGLTVTSIAGIELEMIIRQAASGARKEPKTINRNFNWHRRYAPMMVQEKNDSADLSVITGATPNM